MRLQGVAPERPFTHDLFARTLAELGVRVEQVAIPVLTGDTFRATIVLDGPLGRHEIDARPSDALALAVRVEAPILATAAVLARAGVQPSSEADESRLSMFRDFVNSLGGAGGTTDPFVERDPDPGF
jgi:bifunctional DNase/RNase